MTSCCDVPDAQFRMMRSYTSPAFLIGRTWDKLIMGLLLTTL